MVLGARDERDVAAVAADVALRCGVKCEAIALDLEDAGLDVGRVYAACTARVGPVYVLAVTAGYSSERDDRVLEDETLRAIVNVNYLNVVRLIAEFARRFEERGRGCIVAFSSIAAHAPRRRNMVYASAKAGLEAYLRALRHYFADSGVVVQGYALGYVDTGMSFGQRLWLPAVAPRWVAVRVAENLYRDIGVVFLPRYWWAITGALRLVPWRLYKRLSF